MVIKKEILLSAQGCLWKAKFLSLADWQFVVIMCHTWYSQTCDRSWNNSKNAYRVIELVLHVKILLWQAHEMKKK